MNEEQKPPGPPAPPPVEPAKYPEGYIFPEEMLKDWISIPPDDPLIIGPLTKKDLDNLLFSTGDIVRAIGYLRGALIFYSVGNTEAANNSLQSALNAATDGETRNRLLYKSIMESVLKVRRGD
jgi:hypothetical protein